MVNWINHYHRWDTLIRVNPRKLLRVADNTKMGFRPNEKKLRQLIGIFSSGAIDAPVVKLSDKGLTFVDGRHRTILAARFRMATIKIAVPFTEKPVIKRILAGK